MWRDRIVVIQRHTSTSAVERMLRELQWRNSSFPTKDVSTSVINGHSYRQRHHRHRGRRSQNCRRCQGVCNHERRHVERDHVIQLTSVFEARHFGTRAADSLREKSAQLTQQRGPGTFLRKVRVLVVAATRSAFGVHTDGGWQRTRCNQARKARLWV